MKTRLEGEGTPLTSQILNPPLLSLKWRALTTTYVRYTITHFTYRLTPEVPLKQAKTDVTECINANILLAITSCVLTCTDEGLLAWQYLIVWVCELHNEI